MNFLSLTIVACLIGIGADIYAPSIPQTARDLGTKLDLSQFSMTSYMFIIKFWRFIFLDGNRPGVID